MNSYLNPLKLGTEIELEEPPKHNPNNKLCIFCERKLNGLKKIIIPSSEYEGLNEMEMIVSHKVCERYNENILYLRKEILDMEKMINKKKVECLNLEWKFFKKTGKIPHSSISSITL
jgi:hypothetical protein